MSCIWRLITRLRSRGDDEHFQALRYQTNPAKDALCHRLFLFVRSGVQMGLCFVTVELMCKHHNTTKMKFHLLICKKWAINQDACWLTICESNRGGQTLCVMSYLILFKWEVTELPQEEQNQPPVFTDFCWKGYKLKIHIKMFQWGVFHFALESSSLWSSASIKVKSQMRKGKQKPH